MGGGDSQPSEQGASGVTLLNPSSPTSCFGVGSPQEEGLIHEEEPAAPPDVFSGPARCPAPYTFSFEMLVTGPCLLAGGWVLTAEPSHNPCPKPLSSGKQCLCAYCWPGAE